MEKYFVYDFKLFKFITKMVRGIMLIFVGIHVPACLTYDSEKGIDYFVEHGENIASTGFGHYMIYDTSFVNKYPYINGNFYFGSTSLLNFKSSYYEKALLYLQYDAENYVLAKHDVLENTNYSTDIHFSCYGFEFYENFEYRYGTGFSFPEDFVMLSYNDTTRTLLFIGFSGMTGHKLVLDSYVAFADFLYKEFSKYYKFDNK